MEAGCRIKSGIIVLACFVYVLIAFFLNVHIAMASHGVSFESEILSGRNGKTHGRLWMSETGYMLETGTPEEPLSILVDVQSMQATLIHPHQKTYCVVPLSSRKILELNPIEVFRFVSGFYTRQPGGQEEIQGLKCRKTQYLSHGAHLMTAWFFENISIPVKVVNRRFPEMDFELREINLKKIRPEAITLPEGYRKISCASDGEPTLTEWTVNAGTSETIPLEENKPFKLTVTDEASDGQATRGQMVFLRNAPSPIDRVKAPLKLANGQSITLAYPASVQIKAVEFHISKGGVHVEKVDSE